MSEPPSAGEGETGGDGAGPAAANPYRSFHDAADLLPADLGAAPPPPELDGRGLRWVAVLAGVSVDIGVLFGVVLVLAATLLVRSGLAVDPERLFAEELARPAVLAMLFAGLFLGHVGGGFVSGRIAGSRPGLHGLAVAIGFTLAAMVLAVGAEDRDAAPVPAWLNGFELLARVPLTVLGCHAGVARFRLQRARR